MLTVINVVLVILAVIMPKWLSLLAVVASMFIPDVIPVIDEIIAVGFMIRKFFKVADGVEGLNVLTSIKAVLVGNSDSIKSGQLSIEDLERKADDAKAIKTQFSNSTKQIETFTSRREK